MHMIFIQKESREACPVREAGQQPPWMDLVSSQDLTGNSTSAQGRLLLSSPSSLEQWELLNCHLVSAKGPGLPLNPLLLLPFNCDTPCQLPYQQMATVLFPELDTWDKIPY